MIHGRDCELKRKGWSVESSQVPSWETIAIS
jgi:hypothetical protein